MPASTRSTNREETPENQTIAPGSFPTPITTQRPRNQAAEREMADHDEAAALRQQMQKLRTANQDRPSTATTGANDGNSLSPDLASYLQNQGDTSALSRVLERLLAIRVEYTRLGYDVPNFIPRRNAPTARRMAMRNPTAVKYPEKMPERFQKEPVHSITEKACSAIERVF
ncbi:hypothetical protein ACJ73_06648 [Blastomyces percursus]|uniref:Uncharacterized protein n=1 Tax=Blastomyces percursus TaxID=1658174 RepID=A0A1J9R0J6_9EURO|nr:hypothetical protein ACJ73_06648 [Blastomyces percursus]